MERKGGKGGKRAKILKTVLYDGGGGADSLRIKFRSEGKMEDRFEDPDHNYGHLQIEQAQRRAAFYLPRLIAYVKPIDEGLTVPREDIFGLIIHYPDQLPMAFDFTTTFQYGVFPAIQATTTNENQPIMLITRSGFQEIDADDIRGKYADTLTRLFTAPLEGGMDPPNNTLS